MKEFMKKFDYYFDRTIETLMEITTWLLIPFLVATIVILVATPLVLLLGLLI